MQTEFSMLVPMALLALLAYGVKKVLDRLADK